MEENYSIKDISILKIKTHLILLTGAVRNEIYAMVVLQHTELADA